MNNLKLRYDMTETKRGSILMKLRLQDFSYLYIEVNSLFENMSAVQQNTKKNGFHCFAIFFVIIFRLSPLESYKGGCHMFLPYVLFCSALIRWVTHQAPFIFIVFVHQQQYMENRFMNFLTFTVLSTPLVHFCR